MVDVRMSIDEYMSLLNQSRMQGPLPDQPPSFERDMDLAVRKQKKSTKYSRTYKKEFRRLAPGNKMKNGQWKKGGFKRTVRAAHRSTKRILG